MRVVNPLYSRPFAKQLRQAIAAQSASKVKNYDLLEIYRSLIVTNLAFPGDRIDKIERAHNWVYESLRRKGVRVPGWGYKKVFDLVVELLYECRPDPRKPVWVELNDAHKDDVLNGVGLSDEHWCKTQWVPWMLREANDLIEKITFNLDFYKEHAHDPDRVCMNDVYEFYKNVRQIDREFRHYKDLVESCEYGQQIMVEHQAILRKRNAAMKRFDQQIEVLGKRFGVDYTVSDLCRAPDTD